MSLKAKAVIDAAFIRLSRATESSHEASKLLHAALDAAIAGEKGHRRMGRSFGGQYAASVQTAARYFVCKWYHRPAAGGGKLTFLETSRLRLDVFYAGALRQLLESDGTAPDLSAIDSLDYSADIVGESGRVTERE